MNGAKEKLELLEKQGMWVDYTDESVAVVGSDGVFFMGIEDYERNFGKVSGGK